jgi:molybdopterin-guanine dinucleotide biosynthesis protein A
MKAEATSVQGLLLCGGRSTRMGREKATLEIRGEVLWRRQVRVLEEAVSGGVAVAGSREGPWDEAGRVVVDDVAPGAGPIAGICGGLKWAGAGHLVVLAVDLPLMQPGFLRRLIEMRRAGVGVVGVLDGEREPLAAVYPVEALEVLQAQTSLGCFSLRKLWQQLSRQGRCLDVPVPERSVFLNLNRPEDLARLQNLASEQGPESDGERVYRV